MLHLLRLTIVLCLTATTVHAAHSITESVKKAQQNAEQYSFESLNKKVEDPRRQESIQERARLAVESFYAEKKQDQIRCLQDQIRDRFVAGDSEAMEQKKESRFIPHLADDEALYLFISSSMPDETVHNYLGALSDLQEVRFKVVLKGFPPGREKEYFRQVTKKHLRCSMPQETEAAHCDRYTVPMTIKPILFDRFTIMHVPAVVYSKGDDSWKVIGDMSLAYLLEQINREVKSDGIRAMISQLHRGAK